MDWKELKQDLLNQINGLLTECSFKLSKCKAYLDTLELQKTALETRIDYLKSYDIPTIQTTAWCADYSTDLSGIHGSLEIAREWEKGINIQPGYEGGSAYNKTRDGMLQYPIANFPITAYWNLLTLPGFQLYRPTYRYATISNIDYDFNLCTVTIEAVQSKAQHLTVNMTEFQEIHDVPVVYMDCHAAAFENGDKVIVRFTDNRDKKFPWRNPTVIGFKDHPKPCAGLFFQLDCACNIDVVFTLENIEFTLFNSEGNSIPFTLIWNENKEAFELRLDTEYKDENGYYVTYQSAECDNKLIQYPAKILITTDDLALLSANKVIPQLTPYQDSLPCLWEHWKGEVLCESRNWYLNELFIWNDGRYDHQEYKNNSLCDNEEPGEFDYWLGTTTLYTIHDSYNDIQLTGDGELCQKTIEFYHDLENPFTAAACSVCFKDISAYCPDERPWRSSPYTYLYFYFATETEYFRWYIIKPLYTWWTGYSAFWEPYPLPEPDESGNVIVSLNFGNKALTRIGFKAAMSNKLTGQAGSHLECKIDWIDLY